jgi:hypothetical protein
MDAQTVGDAGEGAVRRGAHQVHRPARTLQIGREKSSKNEAGIAKAVTTGEAAALIDTFTAASRRG